MPSLPKQIIGSFEDIGKDVVREVGKLPTDIAGKALESMGTAVTNKQGGNVTQKMVGQADARPKPPDSWDRIEGVSDPKVKQEIARAALAALSERKEQKDPGVWERQQQEAEQKQQQQQQKQAQSSKFALPKISGKRARGDLYGIAAKKQGSEIGKNARQD